IRKHPFTGGAEALAGRTGGPLRFEGSDIEGRIWRAAPGKIGALVGFLSLMLFDIAGI
ncbi:hypothetical protein EV656_1276, partial [Rhodovulum adriaticum]